MNQTQREYLLRHYRSRSVKQLADELKLDRKTVQRELRELLARPAETAAVTAPRPAFRGPLFHAAALAAVLLFAFLLYARTLSFPLVNWDDPRYITENGLIRNFSGENLRQIFTEPHFGMYIPLTLLSYSADYHFTKSNAAGYRLTTLALHLANAALVYAFILLLTKDSPAALAAALIFAVHPVQVESVVWVSERKNVLSTFFFLPSLILYALNRLRPKPSAALFAGSLVFFLAACLAKPSVVVLPLLLVLFDRVYTGVKSGGWLRYAPYFALAAAAAVTIYGITRGEKTGYYGGSAAVTTRVMFVVMMKYLELLFIPVRLSLVYEFPPYASFADPQPALAALGVFALLGGLFYLWKKDRGLFFWAAWYFILLLPVMNIIPFPTLMNDRYLYLPLVGVFTLIFLFISRTAGAPLAGVSLLILALVFSMLNFKRQAVWADSQTLWRETQSKETGHHLSTYMNLGDTYLSQGASDPAIAEFEKVLKLGEEPMAYCGIGIAWHQKGDDARAVENFRKGLSVLGPAPDARKEAALRNSLAISLKAQGDLPGAAEELARCVRLQPGDVKYPLNLGNTLAALGRGEEAADAYGAAVKTDPDHADVLYAAGLFYYNRGDLDKAGPLLSKLVSIQPGHPNIDYVKNALQQIESRRKAG